MYFTTESCRATVVAACAAVSVVVLGATDPVGGAVVYSQSPALESARATDLDFDSDGNQIADEFELDADATVRSVLWRGVYGYDSTPEAPIDFTVSIYGDAGGVPDTSNVIRETSVRFGLGDLSDTGRNIGGVDGDDEYEFVADITPTTLSAGTNYWLSVLTDTGDDSGDTFFWTVADGRAGDIVADRDDVVGGGAFEADLGDQSYFVLDGDPVSSIPSPTAALVGLVGFGVLGMQRGLGRASADS